jgi:hypothetical protein
MKPKPYKKKPPDYLRDYLLDATEEWNITQVDKRKKSVKSLTERQTALTLAACIDLIAIIAANNDKGNTSNMASVVIAAIVNKWGEMMKTPITAESVNQIYTSAISSILNYKQVTKT